MLFILGIERSATTWLSNLMEAHPATCVYTEPMSALTARFRDWPDRFKPITDPVAKAEYFNAEFKILRPHKKWLLTKISSKAFAWKFDLWLSNWLVRKQLANEAARDFSEINFHRKAQLSVQKNDEVELEVVKELRLNFNAQIISHIDSRARVVVIIRNMFSNIRSILKHIEQGNLAELEALLIDRYARVDARTVYKYWRDSYGSLLHKLEQMSVPHLIVSHTELIQNSEEEVQNICTLAGLSDEKLILDYLYDSNKEGAGIHNTNRNHANILEQNRRAEEEIWPKIEDVFDMDDLYPKLRKFIQKGS